MDAPQLGHDASKASQPAPMFSVFIPVRNDAAWLRAAITSVIDQTYSDWELIIGDNASTEDVKGAATVDDDRVRYHRWEEGVDQTASSNRTAALCRGTWIVPLGADDRFMPDALEKLAAQILDRPDVAMAVAACSRLDQDGRPAAATWRFYQRLTRLRCGDYDARSWIRAICAPGQPPWSIGSIALNRSALERVGGYFLPEAGVAADIELALRIAVAGRIRYTDERIVIFTQRLDSEYRVRERLARNVDQEETFLGRALRLALAAHERERGPLSAAERSWIEAAIARSFIQRAAQLRLLSVEGGRQAAWRDIVRAWRLSPGTVLSPNNSLVAIGLLLFPGSVLRIASRALRVAQA